jgi:hypothetical protein
MYILKILFYRSDMLTQSSPVFMMHSHNDSEVEEEERHDGAQCLKIMLEAGADPSLEGYRGDGIWDSEFMDVVIFGSLVNIATMSKP